MDGRQVGLSLTVVVPVHGNQSTLGELHERLLESTSRVGSDASVDLVYVDDASPDGSWDVISELAAVDGRVTGVRLAANAGQVRAIFAGVATAPADCYVVLDADLADPPEVVPDLVREHRAGHDLVVVRRRRPAEPLVRRAGAAVLNLVAAGVAGGQGDIGSSFLLFADPVARAMREELDRHGTHLILPTARRASRRAAAVSAPPRARAEPGGRRRSGYSNLRLARIAGGFVLRYAAGRLLVTCIVVATAARAARARPLQVAAVVAGAALSVGALAVRRAPRAPLYEVAEVIGRRATADPGAPRPPAGDPHELPPTTMVAASVL